MSNNEELAKWIIVPFIIFLTPFIMSFVGGALSSGNDVLYPTGGLLQFLQWFSSVVGIYYAETLGLLTLNIY